MSMKPAIEGGTPTRKEFLPFAKPATGKEEIEAVSEVLQSGWLTTGPKVKQLEKEFANYIGTQHAVAVNSCTAGLHLSLVAHGIKAGDEVIVPSYTFAATANVVVHCNATPVFADIKEEDFGLDIEDVKKKITKKTRAIIPVHYAGQSCDLSGIQEIAQENNLQIIEDCAHSTGATYKGKKTGTFGKTAAFSFYATKNLTTAEGGMITTNDEKLAQQLQILRLHGMSREAWKRYKEEGNWKYEIVAAGYKYNLSDVQAAMGLVQLKKMEAMNEKRKILASAYAKALENNDAVKIPRELPERKHVWHLYPVLLNLEKLKIDRDKFIEALAKENIGTSVHFIPLHLQPYYQNAFGYKKGALPITEQVYEREVSLPIYPNMKESDVEDVIHAIERITKYFTKD